MNNSELSNNEKVEQFKRDLKSIRIYKKKIQYINLELESIAVRLAGVSSPILDGIPANRNPYDQSHKLELMMQEDMLIQERKIYNDMIFIIETQLSTIDPFIRKLCNQLYVEHKNKYKVASENGYQFSGMYKAINRELRKKL